MKSPTLEKKCLDAAISQLKEAKTPKQGNIVRKAWEVFKSHPEFKKEIEKKRIEFSKLK